jgi:hypothetical protein
MASLLLAFAAAVKPAACEGECGLSMNARYNRARTPQSVD